MTVQRLAAVGVEDALGAAALEAFEEAGARVAILDGLEAPLDLRSHAAVVNLMPARDEPRSSFAHFVRAPERRRRSRLLARLAEALSDAPDVRLVQRSTAALYADGGEQWVAENWPLQPNDSTRFALAMENVAEAHRRCGGTAVILRLGEPFDSSGACLGTLARLARKGWRPFDGRTDAYLPLVRIDDVAAAIVEALDAPSQTFNVGGLDLRTNGSLNALAEARVGIDLAPLHPSIRASDRELLERSCRLDSSAFIRATGWQPRPTFA